MAILSGCRVHFIEEDLVLFVEHPRTPRHLLLNDDKPPISANDDRVQYFTTVSKQPLLI
jgi:hypothetical protein